MTKSNTFTAVVEKDIPECLVVDSVKLRQILTNLANNANKFTENGNIDLHCRKTREGEAVFLEFSVKDTGIGISSNKKESIFNRFTQEDSFTNRRFGGTGLGLAISKYFVEKMGGRIWVKSEEGSGSTFYFTIPLQPCDEAETLELLQDADEKDILPEKSSNIPVLLVDDDRINLKLGKITLERLGFIVDTAENGRMALEKIEHKDYRIVLMDMQMPVMDGLEAAEAKGGRSISCAAVSIAEAKDYLTLHM